MKIFSFACLTAMCMAMSCQEADAPVRVSISQEVISQLHAAGFDTSEGLIKVNGGYIVEYDIFLSNAEIQSLKTGTTVGTPKVEHYYTGNLVTGTPRLIKVWIDPLFGTGASQALDQALARYNAWNLTLTFGRVTSSAYADITLVVMDDATLKAAEPTVLLGQSAFPSWGDPGKKIQLNKAYYGVQPAPKDLVTVIAHEIGHAIGLRHTDYMDRRFSCGGQSTTPVNEGGAYWIPGTPMLPEYGSYMLACSDGNDRPFTVNDVIALQTLY